MQIGLDNIKYQIANSKLNTMNITAITLKFEF